MTLTEFTENYLDADQTGPYYEAFLSDPDSPDDLTGFYCLRDGRNVTDSPCPEHAPIAVPGLRLVECTAEPRHFAFVHDRDDYGAQCPYCVLAEHAETERLARQCKHLPWRRWKLTHRIAGWMYGMGISAGHGTKWGDGCDYCLTDVLFRGTRSYVLGRPQFTDYRDER